MVETAFGKQTPALLRRTDAARDELVQATTEVFRQHADASIMTSFPGLADLTGARSWPGSATTATASPTPAHSRPTPDPARSPAPPAGASPSRTGRSRTTASPASRSAGRSRARPTTDPHEPHYQRRRDRGDRHPSTLRHLFSRRLGQLFHCLQKRPDRRRRQGLHACPHRSRLTAWRHRRSAIADSPNETTS
ncbi:transposase IS116/IS110/IS902 [Actinomadura verrucosospora]|uniref:Transposase IS116/IS110/IS902 n=1 Tax=Actinomadura verrucosospora TaxID=46165 RepID=A0A7D3VQV3_ACTVE|nr:transposase IS116/IS110/IS902 [Actinomadura verrucosospora]